MENTEIAIDPVRNYAIPGDAIPGEPRLTIILHPNPTYASVMLNDRVFNNEKYPHSRSEDSVDVKEAALLDSVNNVIGVQETKAGKNEMRIQIADGMLLSEIFPYVIGAVREWGNYDPEIFVENRRHKVVPVYDEYGDVIKDGVRERQGAVNIGVPYKIFNQ